MHRRTLGYIGTSITGSITDSPAGYGWRAVRSSAVSQPSPAGCDLDQATPSEIVVKGAPCVAAQSRAVNGGMIKSRKTTCSTTCPIHQLPSGSWPESCGPQGRIVILMPHPCFYNKHSERAAVSGAIAAATSRPAASIGTSKSTA